MLIQRAYRAHLKRMNETSFSLNIKTNMRDITRQLISYNLDNVKSGKPLRQLKSNYVKKVFYSRMLYRGFLVECASSSASTTESFAWKNVKVYDSIDPAREPNSGRGETAPNQFCRTVPKHVCTTGRTEGYSLYCWRYGDQSL